MALAKTKLAATIRNLWYLRVAKQIEDADAVVAGIRGAIVTNDLADQFTPTELTAMQAVETDLQTLAALPGVTQAAATVSPTHVVEPATVGLEL